MTDARPVGTHKLPAAALADHLAIERLIPRHLERIKGPRDERLHRIERAVQERLTREINHWDGRAAHLRVQEEAGKTPRGLNRRSAAPISWESG